MKNRESTMAGKNVSNDELHDKLLAYLDWKYGKSFGTTFTFRGKNVLTFDSVLNKKNNGYGASERIRFSQMMNKIIDDNVVVGRRYVIDTVCQSKKHGKLYRAVYVGEQNDES